MLQRHLQAVSEKGDQNVRVSAMLQLMVDGTYAEFTLKRTEYRFDLGQLHVARPQDAGISGGKIGAQQVVSVVPFRLLQLFLVHTKLEGLPRDLLAFPRHLQVHERERGRLPISRRPSASTTGRVKEDFGAWHGVF